MHCRSPFSESAASYDCSRYFTIFKCVENIELHTFGSVGIDFHFGLVNSGWNYSFGECEDGLRTTTDTSNWRRLLWFWCVMFFFRFDFCLQLPHTVGEFGRSTGIRQFTSIIVLDMCLLPNCDDVNGRLWRRLLQHDTGKNIFSILPVGRLGKFTNSINIY